MDPVFESVITIVGAVIASGGFWGFVSHFGENKNVQKEMLKGLAHDRITNLCLFYLERGDWITADEYEGLQYLYVPYRKLKGNGSAERYIDEVKRCLKIVQTKPTDCDKK